MPALGIAPQRHSDPPTGLFIKQPQMWDGRRKVGEENPAEEFLSIMTVNITYLSHRVRKWLDKLDVDVVLVQEHHKHTKQGMRKTHGYSMIFSPAHVAQEEG